MLRAHLVPTHGRGSRLPDRMIFPCFELAADGAHLRSTTPLAPHAWPNVLFALNGPGPVPPHVTATAAGTLVVGRIHVTEQRARKDVIVQHLRQPARITDPIVEQVPVKLVEVYAPGVWPNDTLTICPPLVASEGRSPGTLFCSWRIDSTPTRSGCPRRREKIVVFMMLTIEPRVAVRRLALDREVHFTDHDYEDSGGIRMQPAVYTGPAPRNCTWRPALDPSRSVPASCSGRHASA